MRTLLRDPGRYCEPTTIDIIPDADGPIVVGVVVLEPVERDSARVKIWRADPHVYVKAASLENLSAQPWLTCGDGILTIHGDLWDVSYGLSRYDAAREVFLGTRAA